jgi:hypothetical protein
MPWHQSVGNLVDERRAGKRAVIDILAAGVLIHAIEGWKA